MAKVPFEALVEQYGTTVLRVCRAVVGPVDADDAWSETFLAALRAYPELPADANVEAWLVTIAHRKAIDITRAAARRATPVAPSRTAPSPTPRRTTSCGPPWPNCRTSSATPSPTTTSPDCRTATSPPSLGGSVDAARRAAADGIAALRRTYPIGELR